MTRQYYRSELRKIDKQLDIWQKYAQKLSQARATAPTKAKLLETETSLMVLSQEIVKLFKKRKQLVLYVEATKKAVSPSDVKEDIPVYPQDE